jgi:hypothetical protein
MREKPVVCVKAALATENPRKRAILVSLGGFWISLAEVMPVQLNDKMAHDIAAMEQMQAELVGMFPTVH